MLQNEVADRLAQQNQTVSDMIVTAKVDEELDRRKRVAVKALDKLESLRKDLEGITQDGLFDETGKPLVVGYTAVQNAKRNAAKEKISQLESALAYALGDKADWPALERLL